MKISNLSKLVGAGVLAASIAVVPLNLPAAAQQGNTTGDATTTAPSQGVDNADQDNGFDWGNLGWLGLLGLGGLLGLKRDRHNDEVRTTTTNYSR
jgi:hypothetical protein